MNSPKAEAVGLFENTVPVYTFTSGIYNVAPTWNSDAGLHLMIFGNSLKRQGTIEHRKCRQQM